MKIKAKKRRFVCAHCKTHYHSKDAMQDCDCYVGELFDAYVYLTLRELMQEIF